MVVGGAAKGGAARTFIVSYIYWANIAYHGHSAGRSQPCPPRSARNEGGVIGGVLMPLNSPRQSAALDLPTADDLVRQHAELLLIISVCQGRNRGGRYNKHDTA